MVDISKIDMNRIEGLLDKLDSMKYVVESWCEGSSWYRVWSDGWIEQGGETSFIAWSVNGGAQTINLYIPMKDTLYQVSGTMIESTASWNTPGCMVTKLSNEQIKVGIATYTGNQGTARCSWEVKGYKKEN